MSEQCKRCNGKGEIVGTATIGFDDTCPECGGSGESMSKVRDRAKAREFAEALSDDNVAILLDAFRQNGMTEEYCRMMVLLNPDTTRSIAQAIQTAAAREVAEAVRAERERIAEELTEIVTEMRMDDNMADFRSGFQTLTSLITKLRGDNNG